MMLKKSILIKNDYLNNTILLPYFSWASSLLITFYVLTNHSQASEVLWGLHVYHLYRMWPTSHFNVNLYLRLCDRGKQTSFRLTLNSLWKFYLLKYIASFLLPEVRTDNPTDVSKTALFCYLSIFCTLGQKMQGVFFVVLLEVIYLIKISI